MTVNSLKIKNFPLTPGVYQFIDKKGGILYVGRATSLRRRISQYFQRPLNPRIQEMVELARCVKYIQTDTLLEAIILEANLIKKYWPKYNIKDRDNRSFLYVLISKKEDYPKPIIIRGREIENWRLKIGDFYVFGPYQSLNLIKNALKIIRRVFPYSTCLPAGKPANPFPGKPCFDYQIGLCPGVCAGAISKEDYQKNIKNIILFLRGEKKQLLNKLKKDNPEKISALRHVQDVSLIAREETEATVFNLNRIEGYDISHFAGKETFGSMVVFTDGLPDKEQYRLFKIKEAPANDDLRALEEVLTRRFQHPEWQFPDLIMIDGGRPQISFTYKILQKLNMSIPLVGISKLGGDILVFAPKAGKSTKELIQSIKGILLRARDEAHRFALKSSRRKRRFNSLKP